MKELYDNGLVNAAHHQADIIVVIMDNETVALTGFQDRIGAGITAMGENVRPIYPEKMAEALGIDNVCTLDAFDEKAIRNALQQVFRQKGLSGGARTMPVYREQAVSGNEGN